MGGKKVCLLKILNATILHNCTGFHQAILPQDLLSLLDQYEALLPPPPPPLPCSNQWSENKEARTEEKRQDFVNSKVSIKLGQNILIDNIQDVSKTLVTSAHDQGI